MLREDVLHATGLTVSEMARRLRVSRQSLHRILAEEQPITAATALKLGRLLGTSPDSWLNMQRALDLWQEATAWRMNWRKSSTLPPDSLSASNAGQG